MASLVEAEGGVRFREVQRFSQAWLVVLVIVMTAGAWFAAAAQFFFDRPGRTSATDDILTIIVWLLVGWGLPALFITGRMLTEVRADGLYLRFVPFHRRYLRYAWEDIDEAVARQYRPIREYGGWGIRGFKRNRAYNVKGDRGLQLVLKDGRRLLVGSQRAEDLAAAVSACRELRPEAGG